MSPVRNVSAPLADVMARSERRGVERERQRLARRAQALHAAAAHAAPETDYLTCPEAPCRAIRELLALEAEPGEATTAPSSAP